MYFQNVQLKEYRNYNDSIVYFEPGMNVITGDNAQGKTNIVEALYYCAFGKSFRTNKDNEIIKQGSVRLMVKAHFRNEIRDEHISISYNKEKKKMVKINDVPILKMSELIGHVKVILFCPEDMKIVKESPAERRRFLDREISSINRKYYIWLTTYNKTLDHRNNLLKQSQKNKQILDTISVWDEKCAELGALLMNERRLFVEEIADLAFEIHLELTEHQEKLQISYVPSIDINNHENSHEIGDKLVSNLKKRLSFDCIKGYTSIGPHKDDLKFLINGKDVKIYGSQGQKRTALLSLKIAEVLLFKRKTGENPILLLDDVMSELDANRQRDLLRYTQGIQTIITSADIHVDILNKLSTYHVIEINQGCIIKQQTIENCESNPAIT